MPRWLPAVLVVSVLVLLAVAAKPVLLPAGNPRITRENFERIKEGMSQEEVEAILGPAGDCRTGPTRPVRGRGTERLGKILGPGALVWKGDHAEIWVVAPGGELESVDFNPMEPAPVGLLDLLRWRWERWRESRR
jgi:hypothetical protein